MVLLPSLISPHHAVVLKLAFIPESLRNYFTQFGKVDACTIMRDAAGRSRCFAFLTFEEPASVNAVMVREHFLDGKIVRTLLYIYCVDYVRSYIFSTSFKDRS
jgi:RNA recognition motif-containing protein